MFVDLLMVFNSNGMGITDIVLTSLSCSEFVQELTVDEDETLGGSDHAPLFGLLNLNNSAAVPKKKYTRINIRKLHDEIWQTVYCDRLKISVHIVRRDINNLLDEVLMK